MSSSGNKNGELIRGVVLMIFKNNLEIKPESCVSLQMILSPYGLVLINELVQLDIQ